MAENFMSGGTEGIVATAKQEVNNLDNQSQFSNPVDIKLAAYNPAAYKHLAEHGFQQNESWQKFLADQTRYLSNNQSNDYKAFRQIEKMWRQPEFASIVDMYGGEMATVGQILTDYVDWDKVSWWERQKTGIRAMRYGMKINAAKTDLIELEHNGASEEEINAAKMKVQGLEEYFTHNARPYDSESANALASFAVSSGRVLPELIATEIVSGVLAAFTGGSSLALGAARGAMLLNKTLRAAETAKNISTGLRVAKGTRAGIKGVMGLATNVAETGLVYNDTYRVTMSENYDRIKSAHPEMTDEQIYDWANNTTELESIVESLPNMIGIGFNPAITKGIKSVVTGAASKMPADSIAKAAFLKEFKKQASKGWEHALAKYGVDVAEETLTEVVQQAIENAADTTINSGQSSDDILYNTFMRLGNFMIDPLNEKYEDELNTLLTTLPAAAIFGGVGPSLSIAGKAIGNDSIGNTLGKLQRNQKLGADLRAYTQANQDKMGMAAIKEMISGMGNRGDAPTSVYFDKAALQELIDKDPEARRAMERLGVIKQMDESEGNGGVVEVPLADYNEVVNGEKSGVLYEKVKDMVTFQIDALSMSQFNEWVASLQNRNKAEVKAATENEGSVYNRVLKEYFDKPIFEKMTDEQRKANAMLIQLVANRASQSLAKPITAEEWFEENVVLAQGKPTKFNTKETLSQSIKYDTPYTSNGNNFVLTQGMGGETQVLHLTDESGNILSSIEIGKDNIVRETFTAEEHRRKGLGTKLVKESERLFGDLGITTASKEAKQFWDSLGYTKSKKGIKYKKVESSELNQKNKEVVAGWFKVVDGKYVVGLTDNWNATTFSHEVFHLYSRVLQDNYNSGTMSSYWKAQTEKLFKTVDAKPNKKGQYKLTRNQEELLAERFTTYLLENKIENPELNSIFALLRDAFSKTYTQLDMTKHQPDAKTKEAFAVIFGAQDVVAAEQRALGLLEIEKPEGVSQEAYDHYMAFLLESRAKSSRKAIAKYFSIEKYRQSKEYAKKYDAAYTANLQAVEREVAFQIKALAKQLNTTEAKDIMLAYNSTHPDSIISEDETVAALNDPLTATQEAERRTAISMDEDIKQQSNVKEDDTLLSKEMRNPAMAKAFLMEALMNEGKDWAEFEKEYSDLLDAVDRTVQKMPMSKLQNSRRWKQLESVYAQQYQMYAAIGNKERAAQVRRAQAQVVLIQNTMFEMNNRVDRFLAKFPKKLRNAQPANNNTMTAESWDLLQSLMEQYGFKILDRRRGEGTFNEKLDRWLTKIETSEYCPISNLRYFFPETKIGHNGPFGAMTVRQFEVLEHVSNAINSVASREYNLITESEKTKYDTLVALTAARFKDKKLKPFEKDDNWWRKHFGILSNIVNPEPILKALFPEEVQEKLIRPFFSASARAESAFNKWDTQWNNMIKKVNLSNNKKTYSTGHTLSYNNVANLLLAMGTEHSYENWRKYLGLDEAQAETIISEALAEQPQLVDFANSYWAMMAETTELMNDSYRKRYNKLFVKKQPRAFKIGGYEFTGGYVAETKLVSPLADNEGWESIIMGELSSEKLLNDEADGKDLQSIIDNTRGRLRLFARWGHVAPEFNNFVRFVQREDVGAIIGSRAQNYIKGWLRDYHTPAGDSAGLMHALMSATTSTVLGIRFPQALLQLSGIIPAMGILGRGGVRYVTASLARSLIEGGLMHQVQLAKNKSDYMKARYEDPVKTLFGVSKTEASIGKITDKYQKIAMSWITYFDAIVSNATWDASYRMAIDNGMTAEQAKEKADQDVRLSQTDYLTASRARAMKSDWARIITPFSTYMMGMQSVVRGKIAENDVMSAASFFVAYAVVSTFFESMLKETPMPWEPDDDEKYIEKVLHRWYNDSISTAGSTLYPIAGLGSYLSQRAFWTGEKILYPDEDKAITEVYGFGGLAAINYAKQFPDAIGYGMVGIFNGDEDMQRKAIANFVGWGSAGGKKMIKDMLED